MTHKNSISILGCGWLGFPVAELLVENGYGVKVSKRTVPSENAMVGFYGFDYFRIDFNDEPFLFDENFLKSEILIISVPTSAIELDKLEQLLKAADSKILKKIILISSTGIYTDSNSVIIEDDEQFINKESKLFQVEKLVKSFSHFNVVILRLGGLIGIGRNPVKFGYASKVLANPNGRINLVDVEDAVKLILKVILSDAVNETFNCCSDEHPTKKEFYTRLAFYYKKDLPEFDKNTDDTFKIISNQKVKSYFQFEFSSIYAAIAATSPPDH